MKDKTFKLTEDEAAIKEPPVNPCDLLAEIKPLLEDYFVGDVAFDGERITYSLLNGQKFAISAMQINQ